MGLLSLIGYFFFALLMVLIFRKAGYSGLQIILVCIPLVNVAIFIWFALTEWPIQKELDRLKSVHGG